MSASRTRRALGIVTAVISTLISLALMILLGGIGICGGPPLGIGLVGTALLLAAGLSSLGGCLFPRQWWVGSISFSWALYLCMAISLIGMDWNRAVICAACIATSVSAAWIGARIA